MSTYIQHNARIGRTVKAQRDPRNDREAHIMMRAEIVARRAEAVIMHTGAPIKLNVPKYLAMLARAARNAGCAMLLCASIAWSGHAHAGPKPFATVEAAVVAALDDAESTYAGVEAGGAVYQCDDGFLAMAPATDHRVTSVDIAVYTVTGCVLAGLYHTHPKGDSRFSPADIQATCSYKTVSYIKPKDGAIRAFDCRGLSVAAVQVAMSGQRPITGRVL